MFKILNLGSSSRGNTTLITDGNTCILIDAGVNYQKLTQALRQYDFSLKDISAILITHEHGDHVYAVKSLANYHSIPVYLHSGLNLKNITEEQITNSVSKLKKVYNRHINYFIENKPFKIGKLQVYPFLTPHDTITGASVGYYITNSLNEKLCYITDTGSVDHIELTSIDVLLIESNYDDDILDHQMACNNIHEARYERLKSNIGHLSLKQTCDFISRHNSKLKKVMILHYSQLNTDFRRLEAAIKKVASCDVYFASAGDSTSFEYHGKNRKKKLG